MRVLCTLPNASTEIDGVAFSPVDGGMLSDDVDEAVGHRWLTIPGFSAYAMAQAEPTDDAPRRPGRPRKVVEDQPAPGLE